MRDPLHSQSAQPSGGGINLEEALRLLRQAGYPDPTVEGLDGYGLLQKIIDALCELSLHDGLTGLANARHFHEALDRELERAARTGESCSLVMADLDHFKSINDRHGHQAGNVVLQAVARLLAHNLRPMDLVARFGGEEFALILPNSRTAYAERAADRLRARIMEEPIILQPETILRVTISMGGACSEPGRTRGAAALIDAADRQLYRAKAEGRNRACFEPALHTALSGDERLALVSESFADDPASSDGGEAAAHEADAAPAARQES